MQEVFEKIKERLREHNRKLKSMKNMCIALSDSEVSDIENHAYNTAIEIINQVAEEYVPDINVGENEEFCEWKPGKVSDNWCPSCEPNSTYTVSGVAWFRKCPYCGKRLEVVK